MPSPMPIDFISIGDAGVARARLEPWRDPSRRHLTEGYSAQVSDNETIEISKALGINSRAPLRSALNPAGCRLECNMANVFRPRLDVLPAAQQRLWPELSETPRHFTLYGGTAIALRLGHRASVDFDFFSHEAFEPGSLSTLVPYLRGAVIRQSEANTLTVTVTRGGPVQLSFFGGLRIGKVAPENLAEGPLLKVASLLDLAGTKVAVVTQRAEAKDYLDIHALLTQANIPLPAMLAAAAAIYGEQFNPLISLKAISYHDDPTLAQLPHQVRRDLIAAVRGTDIDKLPTLDALRPR